MRKISSNTNRRNMKHMKRKKETKRIKFKDRKKIVNKLGRKMIENF